MITKIRNFRFTIGALMVICLVLWNDCIFAEDILIKGGAEYLGWKKDNKFKTCDGFLILIGDGRIETTFDSCRLPEPAAHAVEASKASANEDYIINDVYFDFDSYHIRQSDAEILKANLSRFNHSNRTFVIEGHADERGSSEYNLVLAEKRAKAVYAFLISLGVNKDVLTIISYGKEKPAVLGHDETTWAKNRRVSFVPRSR